MTTETKFPAHADISSNMSSAEWYINSDYCISDIKTEFTALLQLLKMAGEALERLVSAVDAYETISDETAAVALYRAQKALEKLKTAEVL